MIRVLILCLSLFFSLLQTNANESILIKQNSIQTRINKTGAKILNANKLNKRVVFVYDNESREGLLKGTKALTKRQVVVYGETYKYIETEDELAAYIAREIPAAIRSYDGLGDGWLSSVKIKAAPKKYELVFDKLAVDYMVKAGYNPIGLITFINKSCPQTRQDTFSSKNLTSKRLAYIYQRIYTKYPSFLANNTYLYNDYYQNFLLTSQENRKKLEEKIQSGDKKLNVKYE
ncbi:MAG: hypothetical protein E7Z92_03300 [Cyanobacteria bacterium SIG31]|nr:hypothetical protein [Cyanobacteria bacterium SIG31]